MDKQLEDAKATAEAFVWLAGKESREPQFYYQAYIDDVVDTYPDIDVDKVHAIWVSAMMERSNKLTQLLSSGAGEQ